MHLTAWHCFKTRKRTGAFNIWIAGSTTPAQISTYTSVRRSLSISGDPAAASNTSTKRLTTCARVCTIFYFPQPYRQQWITIVVTSTQSPIGRACMHVCSIGALIYCCLHCFLSNSFATRPQFLTQCTQRCSMRVCVLSSVWLCIIFR